MAISPTVAAWQARMSKDDQSAADSSGLQLFRKSFSDQAFAAFRAKYPSLVTYVVTFKIFDANLEKGNAFGAFALSSGYDDIVYVPVSMVDGNINSCEMAYIRSEDRFTPLTKGYAKRLAAINNAGEARPMSKDVKVEDTRALFRQLIRPPQSSNVVIASGSTLASLPDAAKRQVREYFAGNPEFLKKVASFYEPELLASSLEDSEPPAPLGHAGKGEVVRMESLTKEAASALTEAQQRAVAKNGFAIKDPAVEGKEVFDLSKFVESERNFVKYVPDAYPDMAFMLGETVAFKGGELRRDAVALCGRRLYFPGEPNIRRVLGSSSEGVVLSFVNERPTKRDFLNAGFVDADSLRDKFPKGASHSDGWWVTPVVPRRNGGWSAVASVKDIFVGSGDVVAYSDSDDIVVRYGTSSSMRVTKSLHYGYVAAGRETAVPWGSLFFVSKDEEAASGPLGLHATVSSFEQLRRFLQSLGTTLRVTKDGVSVSVTDENAEKTASFADMADLCGHLVEGYGLSGRQVDEVLGTERSVLVDKTAAAQGAVEMPAGKPVFQPDNLDAFASVGDPETLDAGILASFAERGDIKTLLVDYIPTFQSVLDKLGRVILKFSLNKKKVEGYFGTEALGTLMTNARKVFALVGDLVDELRKYIRMQ